MAAGMGRSMRSATLLERLSASSRGVALSLREDRAAAMRSVLRNLQRLLNTRVGSAAAQSELGTPSPHELLQGYPGTVKASQETIARCISRYEPRLRDVRVSIDIDEAEVGEIAFKVTAKLILGDGKDPISFHTAIGSDGRIRLHDA